MTRVGSEPVTPEVGQIWADNDPRSKGRRLRIESVSDRFVRAVVVADRDGAKQSSVGLRFAINRDRLRPTRNGYRLID